jgi:hypothetical protein
MEVEVVLLVLVVEDVLEVVLVELVLVVEDVEVVEVVAETRPMDSQVQPAQDGLFTIQQRPVTEMPLRAEMSVRAALSRM